MNELAQKAYIFGTIFTLSNKLQVLGDQFDENLTTKQGLFLIGVTAFSEPPMIRQLADLLGYSRQNAKRIAATLEDNGYITMTKDEHDARALRIELTPKCKEYFQTRDKREVEFLDRIFTGFDAELIYHVCKGLAKLELNIKEMSQPDDSAD